MHFEQSAILTVNSHVITRNPRITVSHDKHRTWFLHINNVQQEDRGRYMCQINTITAKTQIGYLNVVGEWMERCEIINRNNNIMLSQLKSIATVSIRRSKWNPSHVMPILTFFFFPLSLISLKLLHISRYLNLI